MTETIVEIRFTDIHKLFNFILTRLNDNLKMKAVIKFYVEDEDIDEDMYMSDD
jgi:hypothetical protein